jgi:hypothetical protein
MLLTTRTLTLAAALAAAALGTTSVVSAAGKSAASAAATKSPTAPELISQILDSDPWGLSGAEVTARAIIKSDDGATREIAFKAWSHRYDKPLSKSLVRFTGPADLAGTSFLQVQKKDGDDDRYLFLPELKRSRRIAGKMRGNSFMGTDFSYADMDRRDIRESDSQLLPDEKLGKYDVYHLVAKPKASDSQYGKVEIWARKDNLVPLKMLMFNKSGTLVKTLVAEEIKRIDGQWFITRSLMTANQDRRSTQLVLESVKPKDDIADDQFTVRNLEKI